MDNDALRTSCRSMARQAEHRAEALRTFGVPVLTLAMVDAPDENTRPALAFIREHSA